MTKHMLLSVASLAILSACAQPAKDCSVPLNGAIQEAAEEAKMQAIDAANSARAAREEAARAAQDAKVASEKADRIFRQNQNK